MENQAIIRPKKDEHRAEGKIMQNFSQKTKRSLHFCLTFFVFFITSLQALAQCSVHDHGCFHGFTQQLQTNYPQSGTTSVVFYTIGTTPGSSAPSNSKKFWIWQTLSTGCRFCWECNKRSENKYARWRRDTNKKIALTYKLL